MAKGICHYYSLVRSLKYYKSHEVKIESVINEKRYRIRLKYMADQVGVKRSTNLELRPVCTRNSPYSNAFLILISKFSNSLASSAYRIDVARGKMVGNLRGPSRSLR